MGKRCGCGCARRLTRLTAATTRSVQLIENRAGEHHLHRADWTEGARYTHVCCDAQKCLHVVRGHALFLNQEIDHASYRLFHGRAQIITVREDDEVVGSKRSRAVDAPKNGDLLRRNVIGGLLFLFNARKDIYMVLRIGPNFMRRVYERVRTLPVFKPRLARSVGRAVFARLLPRETLVCFEGRKIWVDSRGNTVGRHLIDNIIFEPGSTRVFKAVVRPGMTVIDVGAHVGY